MEALITISADSPESATSRSQKRGIISSSPFKMAIGKCRGNKLTNNPSKMEGL
jgi:hypothetical protein